MRAPYESMIPSLLRSVCNKGTVQSTILLNPERDGCNKGVAEHPFPCLTWPKPSSPAKSTGLYPHQRMKPCTHCMSTCVQGQVACPSRPVTRTHQQRPQQSMQSCILAAGWACTLYARTM
eukprot:1137494-Pelagomonas_calceolata.AAC.4